MNLESHPQFCQIHAVRHAALFMLTSISFNVIQWFPRRCPQWLSFSTLVLLVDNIYLRHLFGSFRVALPFFHWSLYSLRGLLMGTNELGRAGKISTGTFYLHSFDLLCCQEMHTWLERRVQKSGLVYLCSMVNLPTPSLRMKVCLNNQQLKKGRNSELELQFSLGEGKPSSLSDGFIQVASLIED